MVRNAKFRKRADRRGRYRKHPMSTRKEWGAGRTVWEHDMMEARFEWAGNMGFEQHRFKHRALGSPTSPLFKLRDSVEQYKDKRKLRFIGTRDAKARRRAALDAALGKSSIFYIECL